ncbi:MAG TPA: DNA ligase D [Kiloniellales bacterium]|nr:DNA ligase D [Kiloniellales bacterium]
MAERGNPLSTYWQKRRFDETPEPRGKREKKAGWQYSIQKHAATRLHYDLRLELDGVLKSWAVTRGPSYNPADKRLAVRTEDHPVDYLEFEGTIPPGNYGAGTVLLWDRGTWEPVGDPHEALKKGKMAFHIYGNRLKGLWALVRMKPREGEKRENWLLIKERDELADPDYSVTEEAETSVKTGRDLEEISAGKGGAATWTSKGGKGGGKTKRGAKAPAFVAPQLATLVDDVPAGSGWVFEMKFDGYRAIAAVSGDQVALYTRSGQDWTERFVPLPQALADLDLDRVLLDGEIVVVDEEGRGDFSSLQKALSGEGGELSYFVFDLLAEAGKSQRDQTLVQRKKRLQKLLAKAPKGGPVFFTDHIEGKGEEFLEELCKRGFEGIIAKRADQPYRSGRTKSWLKIKCGKQQEFVIVGWTKSDKKDRAFSSLLLAVHEAGELRFAGKVGAGFSDTTLAELAAKFRSLASDKPTLQVALPPAERRRIRWLKPKLVAEVEFAEFTSDGSVRHGRFLGLREDKVVRDVKREEPVDLEAASKPRAKKNSIPTIAGVRISHPDRVLYENAGLTKEDLARYLEKAAPRMLEHLGQRLVSLVRCPEGTSGTCFFQRHRGAGLSEAIDSVPVKEDDGTTEDYLHIRNVKGLVTAAQMGGIEFHVWGSRVDRIEQPDRLVFDLDPAPDVAYDTVADAAHEMKAVLEALELESFAMLTGGKGIHVVVPIVRQHEWPTIKDFTGAVARQLAEAHPTRYVSVMTKAKRKGRIFIDYLRNGRTATAICPFSPRARAEPSVAWPVSWPALGRQPGANAVTIETAMKRLGEPDPWKGYAKLKQRLSKAALKAVGVES